MFKFTSKENNKKISDIKRLLDISRGKTMLKEALDTGGNVDTRVNDQQLNNEPMPNDIEPEVGETTEQKTIEQAIENSVCTKYDSQNGETIVSGYIAENGKKSVIFNYKSNDSNPMIRIDETIYLTEQLAKSINQIASYFNIWKDNLNN